MRRRTAVSAVYVAAACLLTAACHFQPNDGSVIAANAATQPPDPAADTPAAGTPDDDPGPSSADPSGPGTTICRVADLVPTVGYIPSAELEMARQPVADGTSLFLHRRETAYSNAASDLEIFNFDPVADTEGQLTANDAEDYLLDVRGQAMLLQRNVPTGSGWDTQLVYSNAYQEVVLSSQKSWTGMLWDAAGGLNAPPRSMVFKTVAAWRENGVVYRFQFGGVTEISAGQKASSVPWLEGSRVIWSSHDGADDEIWMWTSGTLQRLTNNDAQDKYPIVNGNRAFWVSDGAAVALDLNTDEITVLDEGPCSPPHADAGVAVFACAEPDAEQPVRWIAWGNHQRVFTYNGFETHELETLGGIVFSPRIAGDRVAWLEYSEDAEFCYPTHGEGNVVVTLASGEMAPRAVAPVGAGCYCCDAYWPEPRLAFTGPLIAWNYPVVSEDPPPDSPLWPFDVGAGYATLAEKRECSADD